jgi:cobalt-zinc-cadmium efflux system membrane fusion protein
MIQQDKRLMGGVAAAVLVAALGGFSVARCTGASAPAVTESGAKPAEAKRAGAADTLAMPEDLARRS